ncbi:zinc protease [Rhodoligotrophos appendicifer]|uniref:M16 family metallopeptidase n=1 Tax=Rhodoligotrophos appendicifer TaxID=987056 RepID=UPI001FE595A0|nr:pitrilysin family protein [Rhodoligotrophos appendicifer]
MMFLHRHRGVAPTFRGCLVAIVCLCLITLAPGAKAQSLFADLTSFSLENGMQVVVIPDHRAPVVTHMVWYKVGSADEPAGVSGIAHFLEHLMFKGTDKIPAGQFSKIVRQNGGEDNAFTSSDYTAYFQRIAKDRLPMVMEMEADRMTHLKLTAQDVNTERDVIIEERRMRIENEPSARLMEQMDAALYLNHPYGKPIIGWMSEMQTLSQEDAIAFYKQYYTPSNAILIVAGDVEPDEVRKMAEKYYGALENTATPGERVRVSEPPAEVARSLTLRDPNVSSPRLYRSYLAVASAKGEPTEGPALDVLSNIMGGGTTSILYRDLVVGKRLASSASTWFDGDGLDYGTFGLAVTPLPKVTMDEIETEIETIIAQVKAGEFSDDQLESAKNSLVAQSVYALDSQAMLARVFGTALTTGQTIADVQLWPQRIKAVTKEQVVAAAQKYLKPERSVTGELLPAIRPVASQTPTPEGAPGKDVPAGSPAAQKEGQS